MIEVSIIIPVYEKVDCLDKCLESLAVQTQKGIEIIVVDDGSKEVSSIKYQVSSILKNFDYQFLQQSHQGAGAARNLGVQKAKGKILVSVDSDMVFDKDFISELIRPIKKDKAKGTFSYQEYVANWENIWARCWNYNLGLGDERKISHDYLNQSPVFRAILKTEFLRIGGFESVGYTDDWTLSPKLGYKAILAKGAVYYHYNPANLKEVFIQAKWRSKRRYKFGIFGDLSHLLSYFLPIALLRGLIGAIRWREIKFVIFAIVFDTGAFLGLVEKNLFKNYY